jgi:hypothetical protein
MKNNIILKLERFRSPFSIFAFCLLLFAGCSDLLDPEANLSLTSEQVMTTYGNTQARAMAIYTFLPDGFFPIEDAMMASASDEAEHTQLTASIHNFNTGSWNAVSNPDQAWVRNFQGIYNANLFLANSDSVDLGYMKYDPDPATQRRYQERLDDIRRWKYETRFLRAFFYFELVKRYGGVPLIKEPRNLDEIDIPRSPLSDCIQFIVDECDSVATAEVMYLNYDDAFKEDLGRVTKGAALALKSRVLLYAASDLFNDPSWAAGYAHPELISLTDDKTRQERWEEAAIAANAVIRLDGTNYGWDGSYDTKFKSYNSKELILAKRNGYSNKFEKVNYPVGFNLGNSGTTPTANLVDDYEVVVSNSDVVPFDWTNPAHAANPYANRDPRLAYSVLTNNVRFKDRNIEAYTGGLDGKGIPNASRTGYYLNKYIYQDVDLLENQSRVHTWILFRLGEMYLNLVEAANEAYGPTGRPSNFLDIGFIQNAGLALNTLRATSAGMPRAIIPADKKEFRELVRHERRIELAFEDHRFWDVRRWMIAEETLGVPIRGVEITKTNDGFTYTPVEVEKRTFQSKMYFYPIPQKDLNIAKNWVQNPGW